MIKILIILLLMILTSVSAAVNVNIDGTGQGRTFEGIGAVSAGASSRLLIDYPEPYRSDILDFLFKPKFGAGFQHLKVEIGGDTPACGAEPSFARTRAEMSNPNYSRGYEYWLMQQANLRNPDVILDCLQWGAPGWIGNGTFYSQDNADYIVKFLEGARDVWGVNVGWVGCWNETPYDRNYLVNILRPTLNANGFSNVKIVAPDSTNFDGQGWSICQAFLTDPQLKDAVDAVGAHYCLYYYPSWLPTQTAKNCGKPLWSSEDFTLSGYSWENAMYFCLSPIIEYVEGKITKYEVWNPIDSYYDNMIWPNVGVMTADRPWSGHYVVEPAVWAAAHWTQFAEPNWKFLDSGCSRLASDAGFVTLKKPDSGDYSIIIVTGTASQSFTFNLSGGLSTGTVHIWKSDSQNQFIQQSDITPADGSFTISCMPNSIYSITTTTGQLKGTPPHPIPADTKFSDSFSENFEGYASGLTPKYFADMAGAFETANRYGGGGKALRQVMTSIPISWPTFPTPEPWTELGEQNWQDVEIIADALIESGSGNVVLYARATKYNFESSPPDGYALRVTRTGNWSLKQKNSILASGTVSFGSYTWHNLKLRCIGNNIRAYIDSVQVANVTNTVQLTGLVGVGSGWHNAQFDNFNITVLNRIPHSKMTAIASSYQLGYEPSQAIDDITTSTWHVQWSPILPLPQSITLNLGGMYRINKLWYLPRQDSGTGSQNGIITAYKIYTSLDGSNWTQAAAGSWALDKTEKSAEFSYVNASYVRLEATSGYGGYAGASEININGVEIVPHTVMTASATSSQAGYEPFKAIDDTMASFWRSQQDISLPQSLTLNLGGTYRINKLLYLPRQDNDFNGVITSCNIYTSLDGSNWTQTAICNWVADKSEKSVEFAPLNASYIKVEATAGYGGIASADEININGEKINPVPHSNMTATATSYQAGYEPYRAIDNVHESFWCASWDPYAPLPESVTLNLGSIYRLNKLWYLPRQDTGPGDLNGTITGYKIYTSLNGAVWTQAAVGNWAADKTEKSVEFAPVNALFIRLETTEGYGDFASIDEINLSGEEIGWKGFFEHWLDQQQCGYDYNKDGIVNFLDYAMLIANGYLASW